MGMYICEFCADRFNLKTEIQTITGQCESCCGLYGDETDRFCVWTADITRLEDPVHLQLHALGVPWSKMFPQPSRLQPEPLDMFCSFCYGKLVPDDMVVGSDMTFDCPHCGKECNCCDTSWMVRKTCPSSDRPSSDLPT